MRREEKSDEGVGDWLDGDENMGPDSLDIYYCQVLLFKEYHSNETSRSLGVRRSWREFCSLLRQNGK
jgi:hypothetical protein